MKIISGEKVVYGFNNKMEAVDKISINEEFIVKTNDCFFGQVISEDDVIEEIDAEKLNPATGPIYIEEAKAGDILKIDILDIKVNNQGVTLTTKKGGALGDLVKEPLTKIIQIENNLAHFKNFEIPIRPMIGVIGVATDDGDGFLPTNIPYSHGGNMDTKEIVSGTSLYLPIKQDGAYLALGDLHAVMGDGEICSTGLEVAGEVRLKVDIIKNKTIDWPILETKDDIVMIASQKTMDKALHSAASSLVNYISHAKRMPFEEAYLLSSLVMDARISQVVNPFVTVRCAVPKYILSMTELIRSL